MNHAHRANTSLVDHPCRQLAGLAREMSRWERALDDLSASGCIRVARAYPASGALRGPVSS
jgi:hypothetical protein